MKGHNMELIDLIWIILLGAFFLYLSNEFEKQGKKLDSIEKELKDIRKKQENNPLN